jgi:hypothetical protein
MAVKCSKCGEELLGAVNRCWKCGQMFALRPEIDGRPPVRTESPFAGDGPLEAIVVEPAAGAQLAPQAPAAATLPTAGTSPFAAIVAPAKPPLPAPYAIPPYVRPRRPSTAELIDARRASMMAMGGTVASIFLGIFAAALAVFWPVAAAIALLGLVMGIWGLYSPRRGWALVGMLLCCLAIGIGTYGFAHSVYVYIESKRPTVMQDEPDPTMEEQ